MISQEGQGVIVAFEGSIELGLGLQFRGKVGTSRTWVHASQGTGGTSRRSKTMGAGRVYTPQVG